MTGLKSTQIWIATFVLCLGQSNEGGGKNRDASQMHQTQVRIAHLRSPAKLCNPSDEQFGNRLAYFTGGSHERGAGFCGGSAVGHIGVDCCFTF